MERSRRPDGRRLSGAYAVVVALVLVLIAIVAIDCANATGESSWFSPNQAPNMASVGTLSLARTRATANAPKLAATRSAVEVVALALLLWLALTMPARPTSRRPSRRWATRAPPAGLAFARVR